MSLASPAIARAGDVTMVMREIPVQGRSLQSAQAPIAFNMLGLHWQGSGSVSFRTLTSSGWSAWSDGDADSDEHTDKTPTTVPHIIEAFFTFT